MSRLTEKFFSLSPLKRIFIAITILIFISVIATSYSFFNLLNANKEFFKAGPKSFDKYDLEKKLKETGNQFTNEINLTALSKWQVLANFSKELLKENPVKSEEPAYFIATHTVETRDQIIKAIETFNNFEWKALILFAYYQTDITTQNQPVLSLREARSICRFLSCYQDYLLSVNTEFDISKIISASQKITRITETTNPFLIGKMVGVAMDNMQAKALNELIQKNKITDSVAKSTLDSLLDGYSCETNFYQTLENELSFFKTARGRSYIAGPLAFYILDIAFGNPELEYLKILEAVRNNSSESEISKLQQGMKHPLLMIFFPNMKLAKAKYLENQVLKAIICSKLGLLAKSNRIFMDPYSKSELKSLTSNGQTIFYSVGPDLQDNKGSGDDISFKSYKEGLIKRENARKNKK